MTGAANTRGGFVTIWEFTVSAGKGEWFERVYGSGGVWERFFQQGAGYLGTTLHRDLDLPGRYVTFDFWESAEAYEKFRREYGEQYTAIDTGCEAITESERHFGSFRTL
jgi:heme-degrading monooxygenase HmoA